jgi:hypothetical protein
VNEHWVEKCPVDMYGLGPDMSGFGGYIQKNCQIYLVHPETFFSILILELRGTKIDET